MTKTVIGIFDSSTEAQNAVQQLVSSGISSSNIDIADRSTSSTTSSTNQYDNDSDDDSIGGFFRSLFGSDDESSNYSQVARRGCTVTVHAQSEEEASRAADLLDDYGAVDVDERAQQYRSQTGYTNTGANNTTANTFDSDRINTGLTDTTRTDRTDAGTSIPIIEENLQVGKRETETGGVRVRSRIVERPVEEHLRLREEHVNVQRNPVNRPASDADFGSFKEGTIEMTEHAEVPVVNKEARVVEEITLGKEVTEREEVVRDTVRKTEVDVDNLGTSTNREGQLNTDNTNYTTENRRTDADSDSLFGTDIDNNRNTAL